MMDAEDKRDFTEAVATIIGVVIVVVVVAVGMFKFLQWAF